MSRKKLGDLTPLLFGILAMLAPGSVAVAQEQSAASAQTEARSPDDAAAQDEAAPAEEDVPEFQGYRDDGRLIGGPTDVESDLDLSFPKKDSIFPAIAPGHWVRTKERLWDEHSLKLAFSYQSLYQRASGTMGSDDAWGGWALIEGKWEAVRRGKDYEGSLTFALDWRHDFGSRPTPSVFGTLNAGSLWPTDLAFDEWDPSFTVLYWEQWFKKNVLELRVGKQLAANTFDFFRFKDSRTSFSSIPYTLATSIPAPGFGQAISFKWWPLHDTEHDSLYVHGTLNDMNGDPEDFGLDTFFEDRQYFYGLEIGYFWRRQGADFDHVHLDLFYADERDDPSSVFPNESGGGFKVLGSKQNGRLVSHGSYTYNEAEGGGFGITFSEHTLTGGLNLLKPFGVRGEIGLAGSWQEPINNMFDDQWGLNTYWKLLLTPDVWITPGVQFIRDPVFNPTESTVTIYQFKFRIFL